MLLQGLTDKLSIYLEPKQVGRIEKAYKFSEKCHLGQMRPGSSDGESLARYLPSYFFDRHSQARRFENGQRTNTKKTTPMKQGRMQKRRKVFARRRKIRKQGTAL